MNIKNKYLEAVSKHDYNEIIETLIENLIEHLDYKSISDLGVHLFDVNYQGISINLNEEICLKLSLILIKHSYYSHPDIYNAFAYQFLCLEKIDNYNDVIAMKKTALLLHNPFIINNIAFAYYKSGDFEKALQLQKCALGDNETLQNSVILNYNLMLYELNNHYNVKNKYDYKIFLDMLISDDFFDYEEALMISIYFDDFDFVQNNIDYFEKTFDCDEKIKIIISDYLNNRKIISCSDLLHIVSPKTYYENVLYITNTNDAVY